MKWFSRDWQQGQLSDDEYNRICADYDDHVQELRPLLPAGLQLLGDAGGSISLHDGHFVRAEWKVGQPDLLLVDIACWDIQSGTLVDNAWDYPLLHVQLAYRGAELVNPTREVLRRVVRDPATEILYGEVDIEDQRFAHRMLLWPPAAGHVAVTFETVDVAAVRFVDGRAALIEIA